MPVRSDLPADGLPALLPWHLPFAAAPGCWGDGWWGDSAVNQRTDEVAKSAESVYKTSLRNLPSVDH